MANLFGSSIGRKLVMSLSGLFLVLFLFIHLLLNSFLILDCGQGDLFNAGVHFMGTNPMIKVIEPVLAIGFIIHIVYSLIITLQNRKARGRNKYGSGTKTKGVTMASNNMLWLGTGVACFLILHIADFWFKMKVSHDVPPETTFPYMGEMVTGENAYALVNTTFKQLWVVILYSVGSIALGYHVSHGFWSGFQTMGINNTTWLKRLKAVSVIAGLVLGLGFTTIAVVQHFVY